MILFVAILFVAAAPGRAFAAPPVEILVVHAYSQEYPWTRGQHLGFMNGLARDPHRAYDVRVEYLDTKRTGYDEAYATSVARHLGEKYRGYGPAAVYVTDDNGLSFARNHLGDLFPGVPVFFSGVKTRQSPGCSIRSGSPGCSRRRRSRRTSP
ncbi:hypothetical protein CJ010_10630 [Azoarcus sp. DD4]|uniref:hypothetical protein n=1 Tax=Azoarcus sp. DD4 TaxID=2027405 RepID=UPI00112A5C30|nr:hypothetical protein [Azoarcus sp. DD4]QDF96951.1 hypothetical protein CJ010_10630 [Azoarcus sp. DD4]